MCRELKDEFGDVPRRWAKVFQKTDHTGWNLGLSLWCRDQSPVSGRTWSHHLQRRQGCSPLVARRCSQSSGTRTEYWTLRTDFLAKSTTISGAYYTSVLSKLREAVKIKRRGKISKGILLLQDNALVHNPHVSDVTRSEAQACGYDILPPSPDSPDLTPSEFHLFPAMKLFLKLKGKRFLDYTASISEVTSWLEDQPGVFYKKSSELHQTMGEMRNSGWFLCWERLITVPSFVALLVWGVGQGHHLLNALVGFSLWLLIV